MGGEWDLLIPRSLRPSPMQSVCVPHGPELLTLHKALHMTNVLSGSNQPAQKLLWVHGRHDPFQPLHPHTPSTYHVLHVHHLDRK